MPELRSLFIDFNCYFAAIEQQTRPYLRGQPVGVAPVEAETTCCIAASYEARRFGIKTGTRVADARRLCPQIQIVLARPPLYVQYHERAVAVVDRIVPVRQVVSIDEMECELPRRWRTREAATRIAQQVKAAILADVGDALRTSIGIAPNQLLAKAASDLNKPDGLVVLEMTDVPRLLHRLPATALCGIGPRMGRRLARHGIDTLEDLFAAPRSVLRAAWGAVHGAEMHEQLRGAWAPLRSTPPLSLGHSHVLPPDMRTPDAAYAVLCRLLHKAAMRLRMQKVHATQLSVHVRASRHEPGLACASQFNPTQDSLFFQHSLQHLWTNGPQQVPDPLIVGLVLSGLSETKHAQNCLITDISHTLLHETPPMQLMQMVDALNRRFGKNTVYFGNAHEGRDHAPMRVAFNRIPDVDAE